MTLPATRTRLNQNGVKDSADRFRTWGGERFECWSTEWNDARARRYRAAGLTVRKFEGEMFLRPADFDTARQLDTQPLPTPNPERQGK